LGGKGGKGGPSLCNETTVVYANVNGDASKTAKNREIYPTPPHRLNVSVNALLSNITFMSCTHRHPLSKTIIHATIYGARWNIIRSI